MDERLIGENGKTTQKLAIRLTSRKSTEFTWALTFALPTTQFHLLRNSSSKLKFIVRDDKPYQCKASFYLIFSVKPIVRINHKWDQAVSADFGATITFKCESEGFPEPILYWERADGVVIVNDSSKYRIDSHTIDT